MSRAGSVRAVKHLHPAGVKGPGRINCAGAMSAATRAHAFAKKRESDYYGMA